MTVYCPVASVTVRHLPEAVELGLHDFNHDCRALTFHPQDGTSDLS